MKKFLVLTLVLGIASLATAGFSISGYDGQPLRESDTIVLNIGAAGGQTANAGVILGVVIGGPGSVAAGPQAFNAVNDSVLMDLDPDTLGLFGLATGTFFDLAIPSGTPPVIDGTPAGGILFHCDGIGDVTLQLVDLDTGAVYDSITISQVPEPATMALLGLGALVLRRKK